MLLTLLLLLVAIVGVLVLGARVTQQFEGRRWTLAGTRLRAADRALRRTVAVGREVRRGARAARLPVAGGARTAGHLSATRRPRGSCTCGLFAIRTSRRPRVALRIGFSGNAITSLADAQGADIPVIRLDPLLIGSIFPLHGEDRIIVAPDEVPPLLPAALKAVEDRKFDSHHGVNPLAILRAMFVNVRAGQIEQGGSTLTQQLVKSYFLDSRRTLGRKAEEAVMAVILESRFEKADIMNAYINEIYLGQDGTRAVHGFGLASQFYFGKPLAELGLAGDRADGRDRPRALVLRSAPPCRTARWLGATWCCACWPSRASSPAKEAERAAKKPLGVAEAGRKGAVFYPAFLDLVRRQLRTDYEESDLTEAGLTVFSTLDPLLQEKAESALASELERQDKSARKASHGLEGVVIVTTPQTGEVVAIVGGRRASFDGFNRALDAKRPIGSLAKPLVYLAALETGRYTPASIVHDQPVEIKLPNGDTLEAGELRQGDTGRHAGGARAHAVAEPADGQPRARGRSRRASRARSSSSASTRSPPSIRPCCSARPT